MRDPRVEHLRYLHGDECVPTQISDLGDLEILRNDIDRLDLKVSRMTQALQEVLTEIKKINTL